MFALGLLHIAVLTTSPSVVVRTEDALTLVDDINAVREADGRATLQVDPRLNRLATAHAVDMARNQYFGHETLAGADVFVRLRRAHVFFRYAGEDLEFDRNVTSAEEMLWSSQPHRSNALAPTYTSIGAGAVSTPFGEFFVEEFAG